VLAEQLEARGATLDALTEAAETGVLEITLDWHLRALKAGVEEKS